MEKNLLALQHNFQRQSVGYFANHQKLLLLHWKFVAVGEAWMFIWFLRCQKTKILHFIKWNSLCLLAWGIAHYTECFNSINSCRTATILFRRYSASVFRYFMPLFHQNIIAGYFSRKIECNCLFQTKIVHVCHGFLHSICCTSCFTSASYRFNLSYSKLSVSWLSFWTHLKIFSKKL